MKPIIPIAGVLAALLVAGCGSDSSSSKTTTSSQKPATSAKKAPAAAAAPSAKAGASKVDIKDFDYSPKAVKVAVGAKVTWTNRDDANHTVTFDTGAKKDLGSQNKGKAVSMVFAKAGTYAYHCDFHPNMHGTVVVR